MGSKDEVVWKESFFEENFNVDQCLSKYTVKSDLESLRNDLRNYGGDLHLQMAEILKTETEAIVNLAEYLTNLNSNIDDLSLPIMQLREEIKTLYELIRNAQNSYYLTLERITKNSIRQNYLNLKCEILNSALYVDELIRSHEDDFFDDSIILERAVNKFSFEYNYLEAFDCASHVEEIEAVSRKLTKMINGVFLKSISTGDESVILRCLRMYDNLGQPAEAEETYRAHIVRPALKNIFTEKYLASCGQDLDKIYAEAVIFLDTKLITLLLILESNEELKSFDFVFNSFWLEVDKLSREGLPHVTAPGNPEQFQKRFTSTWEFLSKVRAKCKDRDSVERTNSFQNHIKRFNLPVYFEIRFQQIAGHFEAVAISRPGPKMYTQSNSIGCMLDITTALWKALLHSFSSNVFIENLADQFLKLSLLLLTRYLKWFDTALQDRASSESADFWEDFVIHSITDFKIIESLIGASNQVENTIYKVMPDNLASVLVKVLKSNTQTITAAVARLQDHLISVKTNDSFMQLQSVAAIPRLYRRTNRSAPKEASGYMVEALQPTLKFHEKYKTTMSEELQVILDKVIINSTKQYSSLVEDVLRSVCKTEESLRRLKNRNTQISEVVSEDSETDKMSDEMKIREQIKLDVCYFVDKVYPLATEKAKKCLADLRKQTS